MNTNSEILQKERRKQSILMYLGIALLVLAVVLVSTAAIQVFGGKKNAEHLNDVIAKIRPDFRLMPILTVISSSLPMETNLAIISPMTRTISISCRSLKRIMTISKNSLTDRIILSASGVIRKKFRLKRKVMLSNL